MTRGRHLRGLSTFAALNARDKSVSINFLDFEKIMVVVLTTLAQFVVNAVAGCRYRMNMPYDHYYDNEAMER